MEFLRIFLKKLKKKNIFFIDATCPLVTKVHREAERHHKNGCQIILIGHKDHPEVIGTMGQLPVGSIKLIETEEDAKNIGLDEFNKPLAYVTQTTLSVDDTKNIIEILRKKFPNIKSPIKEDICYATTNRQNSVKKIATNCEMFFVIGSENSSNSKRLVETAKKFGCTKSELFDFSKNLPINQIMKVKTIGLTSGASAPEKLIKNFISALKKYFEIEINEIITTEEKVTFKLPKSLN